MSKKISELSAITEVQSTDLLYAVRDVNGTPTDFKITKEALVDTVVPTKVSDLTNDSGFITAGDVPANPSDVSDLTDTTGVIPADTGDLTNNAGFITAGDIPASGGSPRKQLFYNFNDISATSQLQDVVLTNSTIELVVQGMKVNMGGTNGDRALFKYDPSDYFGYFDRNPSFSIGFNSVTEYNLPSTVYFGGFSTTNSDKIFGFRWNADRELYAVNGNGTSAKETYLTGVSFGGEWIVNTLSAVMTSGSKIEFFVDGVLVATHTENLPSGDSNGFFTLDFTRNANTNASSLILTDVYMGLDIQKPA